MGTWLLLHATSLACYTSYVHLHFTHLQVEVVRLLHVFLYKMLPLLAFRVRPWSTVLRSSIPNLWFFFRCLTCCFLTLTAILYLFLNMCLANMWTAGDVILSNQTIFPWGRAILPLIASFWTCIELICYQPAPYTDLLVHEENTALLSFLWSISKSRSIYSLLSASHWPYIYSAMNLEVKSVTSPKANSTWYNLVSKNKVWLGSIKMIYICITTLSLHGILPFSSLCEAGSLLIHNDLPLLTCAQVLLLISIEWCGHSFTLLSYTGRKWQQE